MRLAAYLRVSTKGQTDGYGLDIQRAAIRDWAKASGHKILEWHTDTISGASELASREGWRSASALVKRGNADGIVVARLDRLARDLMVQEVLLRRLSEFGGVVMSTRASENEMLVGESKDPSRKLVRTILGAISEYDREMITDRLTAARKAKAAAGGHAHGALPFGYRSVEGALVEVPEEQAALLRMHTLAATGASTRAIAWRLTAEGYPTKRGGQWSSPTVARILKRTNISDGISS